MPKKTTTIVIGILIILSAAMARASEGPVFSVTGAVSRPLFLTGNDLACFQTITVSQRQFTDDGHYLGEVYFEAVPLKMLLDFAGVAKEFDASFSKTVDLAMVVKNKDGNRAAFSWGEVFEGDPVNVVIALSALPGVKKNPKLAGEPDAKRAAAAAPALIVSRDLTDHRCLPNIANIDVVNVTMKKSFSRSEPAAFFVVAGDGREPLTFKDLSKLPRTEVRGKQLGKDPGLCTYSGAALSAILENAGLKPPVTGGVVVSSFDGYRSFFSAGELLATMRGERIIIADKATGAGLKDFGPFALVCPDDATPGRWIKAVTKVEVVDLTPAPKLYVIGTGCGDSNLVSLEALSFMGRVDALITPDDLYQRFASYLAGKPVLTDQKECNERFVQKKYPDLTEDDVKQRSQAARDRVGRELTEAFQRGWSVALLEYGDPTLYSTRGWRWLYEYLEADKIEVVPGLSSFNASNALIAKDGCCRGGLVIAVPRTIEENEPLIKAAADKGETLALFMALTTADEYVPILEKYYAPETPAAISYNAGIGEKEKLITTTLAGLSKTLEAEAEKFLGMVYIGPCLQDGIPQTIH